MRLGRMIVAFAAVTAVGLMAAPTQAQQPTTQRTYTNGDHTVFTSRDENGRTRTKIIVQKRSYLDPGTEPLPSEHNTLDYVQDPAYRGGQTVLNHTIFGTDMLPLPGPFDLPSNNNPWLRP
jgi:hypothetical protein